VGPLSVASTLSTKARWIAQGIASRIFARPELKVIREFPIFVPNSAGSVKDLSRLTVQAADQTFPFLLDLLSRNGAQAKEPVPVASFVDSADKKAAAEQLKPLFDKFGSDKSTYHDYHLLYGSILSEPESVTNVFEVGLGSNNRDVVSNMVGRGDQPGASLRAFREFLPRAQIYGADIDRRILFQDERISTFFIDQTDPTSFDVLDAALPGEFDLIIDDGLHSPNANIATLSFGLGKVKAGGWVVVEDIAPAALPLWQVISALLPEEYESHVVSAKGALLFTVRRSK
jgi:hypothetical protein